MPKLENRIKVRSSANDENGGKRHFAIEMISNTGNFALTDVLQSEGLIEPLEQILKKVCKQTLLSYIADAKELLKSVRQTEQQSAN